MTSFEKIKNIIAEQLSIDPVVIKPETTFEEVDADSLDVVEVIMAIESAFSVELPDSEVERFKNVGELSQFVDTLLK